MAENIFKYSFFNKNVFINQILLMFIHMGLKHNKLALLNSMLPSDKDLGQH